MIVIGVFLLVFLLILSGISFASKFNDFLDEHCEKKGES